MPTSLQIVDVACRYHNQTVIQNLSFGVRKGGMASLLGPSGCGKTTVLRAIAGFLPITQGEIRLNGTLLSRPGFTLPPEQRKVGMVFQDFALFPHLDAAGNIAFGLHHLPRHEQKTIVQAMLELVGLPGMGHRYPHELSGGQQQRVALARALAPQPQVILLDEPFSSLDVDLRERLSQEVRDILLSQGITGILVTHDQFEAFAWGDKAGIMHLGRMEQWGDPFDLYHEPASRFVATFIGHGTFVRGYLAHPNEIQTECVGTLAGNRAYAWPPGTEVDLLLRPDDVVPDPDSPLRARVIRRAFKGADMLYTLELRCGTRILALFPSRQEHTDGDAVAIRVLPDHLVAFPLGEEKSDTPPLTYK